MKTRTKVLVIALIPAIALCVAIVHAEGYAVTWADVLILTGIIGLGAGACAGFIARDMRDAKSDNRKD
ncbi:hypothetical protein EIP75_21630 [Aquabacterium soli]|uniref:Uncharacterized protein n=1 Tax=Aquabacterium soli TaxID=2493092 RepID=A0A426V2P1_9BURK|nr:hypothetical protein [Aquabacterium soli]RRS01179.1 hypothetical protein EIP75_21630 [Aquabacterium soli]